MIQVGGFHQHAPLAINEVFGLNLPIWVCGRGWTSPIFLTETHTPFSVPQERRSYFQLWLHIGVRPSHDSTLRLAPPTQTTQVEVGNSYHDQSHALWKTINGIQDYDSTLRLALPIQDTKVEVGYSCHDRIHALEWKPSMGFKYKVPGNKIAHCNLSSVSEILQVIQQLIPS